MSAYPGFWAEAQAQQVQYLPEPPATLEQGPTSDAPGDDYYWVPGCYEWRTRYVWRPGYWAAVNPNWIWVPAHYSWTPYGYVFVPGFWDYLVAYRGVCFAPVYFSEPIYLRPRWYYSPWVSIDVGVLNVSFFSRPSYCHYYFGDYYDPHFVSVGFYPFFAVRHVQPLARSDFQPSALPVREVGSALVEEAARSARLLREERRQAAAPYV